MLAPDTSQCFMTVSTRGIGYLVLVHFVPGGFPYISFLCTRVYTKSLRNTLWVRICGASLVKLSKLAPCWQYVCYVELGVEDVEVCSSDLFSTLPSVFDCFCCAPKLDCRTISLLKVFHRAFFISSPLVMLPGSGTGMQQKKRNGITGTAWNSHLYIKYIQVRCKSDINNYILFLIIL